MINDLLNYMIRVLLSQDEISWLDHSVQILNMSKNIKSKSMIELSKVAGVRVRNEKYPFIIW